VRLLLNYDYKVKSSENTNTQRPGLKKSMSRRVFAFTASDGDDNKADDNSNDDDEDDGRKKTNDCDDEDDYPGNIFISLHDFLAYGCLT